jgi:TldD protein
MRRARYPEVLFRLPSLRSTFLFTAAVWLAPSAPHPGWTQEESRSESRSVLLETMIDELNRSFLFLKENARPAPYFLSYEVTETDSRSISASFGKIAAQKNEKSRWLDVTMRAGASAPDGDVASSAGATLTYEDIPAAIKHTLWLETDRAYRAAAAQSGAQAGHRATPAEDAGAAHYSAARRETPLAAHEFDAGFWTKAALEISARFLKYPRVFVSRVDVVADQDTRYLANTEGTRLIQDRQFFAVRISASSRADDGEELRASESFEGQDADGLPNKDKLAAAANQAAADVTRLRDAPPAEPFTGPAIFSARAAGAFFHELVGRRLEARRRQSAGEAPPFAVSATVLPGFLTIVFDPTRRRAAGVDLNGWYEYDDEGVKARRVVAVEHGVVRELVQARSTGGGPGPSNGHGRKAPGLAAAARESNLIVEATGAVAETKLREMLLAEVRRQRKPYGLYFQDAAGAGGVLDPRVVYRVFPDGRPDELLRGAELAGDPAASLMAILAPGAQRAVVNLHSDGESGSVPVSVVAPSILVSEIRITRKPKANGPPLWPPLLPPPPPLKTIQVRR